MLVAAAVSKFQEKTKSPSAGNFQTVAKARVFCPLVLAFQVSALQAKPALFESAFSSLASRRFVEMRSLFPLSFSSSRLQMEARYSIVDVHPNSHKIKVC